MKGEGDASLGVSFLGIAVLLTPLLSEAINLTFPIFTKVFLGIYGFCVMLGGVYRASYLGSFTDFSAVVGVILVITGPPTDYMIGYEAWSYMLIGSTLLLAVPSAILAVYTYEN